MTGGASSTRLHNDWIEDFVDYARDENLPLIFTKWSALSALAATLERRVFCRIRPEPLYPNLYVMLVGPPASGKSSTIGRVVELTRKVKSDRYRVNHGPDDLTKASLLDYMSSVQTVLDEGTEYTSVYLALDEMGTGLSFFDTGLMTFMSKMFDGADQSFTEQRRTRGKPLVITKPVVNLIVGVQPGFLAQNVPELAWQQGMLSRFVMIYSESVRKKKSVFSSVVRSFSIQQTLLADLKTLFGLQGEVSFALDAKDRLDEILQDEMQEPTHPKLRFYNNRRVMFLGKLAMLSSISRSSSMMIEIFDVERAWEWLHEAEETMPLVFRNMVGSNDDMILTEIQFELRDRYLKTHKPIRYDEYIKIVSARTKVNLVGYFKKLGVERGDFVEEEDDFGGRWITPR